MPQTNGAAEPATPAPIDPAIVVPLHLTVGQINQILTILGTQPLGEVLVVYSALRTQGDRYIASLTAYGQDPEDPPAPPAEPPPPTTPTKPRIPRRNHN